VLQPIPIPAPSLQLLQLAIGAETSANLLTHLFAYSQVGALCCSAFFAGTTLGILTLSITDLQILSKASDEEAERKHASERTWPLFGYTWESARQVIC
jgi:hypothetical protein